MFHFFLLCNLGYLELRLEIPSQNIMNGKPFLLFPGIFTKIFSCEDFALTKMNSTKNYLIQYNRLKQM